MDWFKFHTIWGGGIRELSDAEAGRFIKALIDFEEFGESQPLTGAEKVVYSIACKQLKQDAERNAEISRKRAENGRIGGLSSKQKEANISKTKQNEAKQANASNCLHKELRIKNTELREKNINCADAQESEQTSDPESSDFWKFAKENAELAEAFHEETGLTPIKSQFGRWVNDLRDLAEADITVDRMRKTVAYMRSKDIPISAPGSILKTAQWLKARGSVPVTKGATQSEPQVNRWDKAKAELEAELSSNQENYWYMLSSSHSGEVVEV